MLPCRFVESKVRWTSRVLWMAVVRQSSVKSSRRKSTSPGVGSEHLSYKLIAEVPIPLSRAYENSAASLGGFHHPGRGYDHLVTSTCGSNFHSILCINVLRHYKLHEECSGDLHSTILTNAMCSNRSSVIDSTKRRLRLRR